MFVGAVFLSMERVISAVKHYGLPWRVILFRQHLLKILQKINKQLPGPPMSTDLYLLSLIVLKLFRHSGVLLYSYRATLAQELDSGRTCNWMGDARERHISPMLLRCLSRSHWNVVTSLTRIGPFPDNISLWIGLDCQRSWVMTRATVDVVTAVSTRIRERLPGKAIHASQWLQRALHVSKVSSWALFPPRFVVSLPICVIPA